MGLCCLGLTIAIFGLSAQLASAQVRQTKSGFTVSLKDGTLQVEACSRNIVHIVYSFNGNPGSSKVPVVIAACDGMPAAHTIRIIWVRHDHGTGPDLSPLADAEVRFTGAAVNIQEFSPAPTEEN